MNHTTTGQAKKHGWQIEQRWVATHPVLPNARVEADTKNELINSINKFEAEAAGVDPATVKPVEPKPAKKAATKKAATKKAA